MQIATYTSNEINVANMSALVGDTPRNIEEIKPVIPINAE